eukprot:CAMPEP_0194370198 /NCGR_PEP_ID=MMETSP0174-20130528/18482_1 /TAXON_ID=216777 /ORGANISM="Proboscia alata, Strain PI-D3" /LENGTH=610 /DNA_ID=CAMNT_0039147505 /DNA_START=50 /DNA_END=1879 /DNA_ORIENTATION=-
MMRSLYISMQPLPLLLLLLLLQILPVRITGAAVESLAALIPQRPFGDLSCPCLASPNPPFNDDELTYLNTSYLLLPNLQDDAPIAAYGTGCRPHDVQSVSCSDVDECRSVVPVPLDCDKSWCQRSWCYVDPENCVLQSSSLGITHVNNPLSATQRRWSYATCGHMDSFTSGDRLKSLKGETLKVAYNSNSGGWKGAYNPNGSFSLDASGWSGPMPTFLQQAAIEGGFTIVHSAPPEWLKNESVQFFGGSSFDFCVYATSLGYLDLCVAAYTITTKRASVADFFVTTTNPVYLITAIAKKDGWGAFIQQVQTVFAPFTWGTWGMIFLFCIPVLGLIMLLHEYGAPGGSYPRTNLVRVFDGRDSWKDKEKKVPIIQHIAASLYNQLLSLFQATFDQTVTTVGGKIHLLASSSLVMLLLAIYTANLAAILTQDYTTTAVSSIEEAIRLDYNFCSERKLMELVLGSSSSERGLQRNMFVPDPKSLGGDEQAGFNCPNCSARTRVFDQMRATHTDKSLYCNAALASLEDLEILNKDGKHCDKVHVGEVVIVQSDGIPISSSRENAVGAFLQKLKNDGTLTSIVNADKPANNCPSTTNGQEDGTPSLSVKQMTGVW